MRVQVPATAGVMLAMLLFSPPRAAAELRHLALAAKVNHDVGTFTLTSQSGDPSTEYINSTGVELAVRFGR
ncbi:MAG TPA: hypothetical protein VFM29_04185 [Vicinamibacteria bacterium]|nr:hypothetical protein [Vicinamibacteria bacterium]